MKKGDNAARLVVRESATRDNRKDQTMFYKHNRTLNSVLQKKPPIYNIIEKIMKNGLDLSDFNILHMLKENETEIKPTESNNNKIESNLNKTQSDINYQSSQNLSTKTDQDPKQVIKVRISKNKDYRKYLKQEFEKQFIKDNGN